MMTRNFIQIGAMVFALLVGSTASAPAQLTVEAEAGPFVGGTLFLSNPSGQFAISRQEAAPLLVSEGEFRNALTVGVTAGVRLAERFGVEGVYAWVPTRMRAQHGLEAHGGVLDVHSIRYGIGARYHLAPQARLQPFAGVGMVGETLNWGGHPGWERETDIMGNVVLGSDFFLRDGVSLRLQMARDMLRITGSGNVPRDHLMLTAGLVFRERIR